MSKGPFSHLFAVLLSSFTAATFSTADPVSLDTPAASLRISPENGTFEIKDKAGGVTWRSNPFNVRFGEATLRVAGQERKASLDHCEVLPSDGALTVTFRPVPDDPGAWLRVFIRANGRLNGFDFSWEAAPALAVDSLKLFEDALWVSDTERGCLAIPVREGLMIPASSGLSFAHRFDTYAYEGCHMAMAGIVKQGAVALVTWQDPYVAIDVRSVLTNAVWAGGKQLLSSSVVLRKTAKSFRVQFLGKGDCVTLAKAYQREARERGWYVPWSEKLKGHPERAQLFGAINFKLWSVLDRRMNEASTVEEQVRVNWTFDEAARVAEHLKDDLQLDRVLFTMGGWIHRGYDNQHPDILPTAPECGGDAAFANCVRRIEDLGYVLCLHDNYQDIYRDSPSWDESFIMRNREGGLARGGHWAGGLAYLTCSRKALELAERPQNLSAVRDLCQPSSYFIDTTYAAGLQECFDPNHPLTRADDLHWKQALSDYARKVFGIFGSECGREWAIPHSDFFEGLTGVSGQYYHDAGLLKKVGGTVVPLFEMVYRDCIAMYGKYGYDIASSAEYVLHHISIGRPLNYHNVPPHLYWSDARRTAELDAPQALFTRGSNGWTEGKHAFDRFVKNTAEILSPLNECTSQLPLTTHGFLTPDRKVIHTVFGAAGKRTDVIVNMGSGEFACPDSMPGKAVLPPMGFAVVGPKFTAFLAKQWNGVDYKEPVLFTIRSLDGQSIDHSSRIRVYHGFGDATIRVRGQDFTVRKQATLEW